MPMNTDPNGYGAAGQAREIERLRAVARAEATSGQIHYEARLRLEARVSALEGENARLRSGWDADVEWANKLLLERDEARTKVERLQAVVTWFESEHGIDDDRVHEFLALRNSMPVEVEVTTRGDTARSGTGEVREPYGSADTENDTPNGV